MSVSVILAISFLPLLAIAGLIIIGRSTFDSLKLLIIAIPLYAFGAIEIGFTVPPAYIIFVLILLGIAIKGEHFRIWFSGGRSIIFFLLIILISTLVTAIGQDYGQAYLDESMGHRADSFRSPIQLALWIFHFALFFVIVNFVESRQKADTILKTHLWIGFVLMIIGSYQILAFTVDLPLKDFTFSFGSDQSLNYRYSQVRLYSAGVTNFSSRATFFESLHFANYLISVVPLGIALWASNSRQVRKKFGFVASPVFALIGIIALFFTMSRSGWIALVFSIVVLALWLSPRFVLLYLPMAALSLFFIAFVFIKIGFFSEGANSLFVIIMERLNMDDIMFDPRILYFAVLWESFQMHPLLGVGAGNFATMVPAMTGGTNLHSAHGLPWSTVADFGLLGLAALTTVIFGILFRLIRAIKRSINDTRRAVMVGLLASISGLLLQALFVGDRPPFHFVLLLGLAVVYISVPDDTEAAEVKANIIAG